MPQSPGDHSEQQCCLIDANERCRRQSGNASFNFRVQKLVEQKKLKFSLESGPSERKALQVIMGYQSCLKKKTDAESDLEDFRSCQCPLLCALQAKHTYICDHHKNIIQKARNKKKRRDSEEENDSAEVDLSQLQLGTLKRYKRHYRIPTKPGMSKSQLIESITKHFKTISAPEQETITYFIYMVKTHKSKLDQRPADVA